MATTLRLWKEIITKKYKESGFNYFGYFDKKYEVVFKKKLSDDLITMWFNAYVKLEEPLQEHIYLKDIDMKISLGVIPQITLQNLK